MEVKKKCGVQWQVIPKMRCSDGYGTVGELEMRNDWGQERSRQEDDLVERVCWMVKSLQISGLGVLQGVVG